MIFMIMTTPYFSFSFLLFPFLLSFFYFILIILYDYPCSVFLIIILLYFFLFSSSSFTLFPAFSLLSFLLFRLFLSHLFFLFPFLYPPVSSSPMLLHLPIFLNVAVTVVFSAALSFPFISFYTEVLFATFLMPLP